jgi:hypothetical protein
MVDKKSTKKRTQVKDLPKKEKRLSAGDMKKVKGGAGWAAENTKGMPGGSGGPTSPDGGSGTGSGPTSPTGGSGSGGSGPGKLAS